MWAPGLSTLIGSLTCLKTFTVTEGCRRASSKRRLCFCPYALVPCSYLDCTALDCPRGHLASHIAPSSPAKDTTVAMPLCLKSPPLPHAQNNVKGPQCGPSCLLSCPLSWTLNPQKQRNCASLSCLPESRVQGHPRSRFPVCGAGHRTPVAVMPWGHSQTEQRWAGV